MQNVPVIERPFVSARISLSILHLYRAVRSAYSNLRSAAVDEAFDPILLYTSIQVKMFAYPDLSGFEVKLGSNIRWSVNGHVSVTRFQLRAEVAQKRDLDIAVGRGNF
ncbi:MAG: hypothetical protein E2O85_04215 [Bacteroidetes bacterium]|nr:MAG: hypothetical protein E2O85_04215 [Bacteroidota bacterium]